MVFNILKKLPFQAKQKSVFDFVQEVNEENKHTPDLSILETFKDLLLFVPDEMRRGYAKYDLIKDEANFKAIAFTQDEMFFFIKDLGLHSQAVPLRHRPDGYLPPSTIPARIKGELFRVNPGLLPVLDIHKENGVQFERRRVEILVPSRLLIHSTKQPVPVLSDVRVQPLTVYMYVGVQNYWDNLIGGIFPAKSAQLIELSHGHWIDKYYFARKGNEL